jgi:precorrin-4/cobalt-precorrin-4 C11-methyltransferase
MNHYPLQELVSRLRAGYGRNEPIALAHRIGLSGQRLFLGTLDDILEQTGDCTLFDEKGRANLTLIIVGRALTAAPEMEWWDQRRLRVRKKKS